MPSNWPYLDIDRDLKWPQAWPQATSRGLKRGLKRPHVASSVASRGLKRGLKRGLIVASRDLIVASSWPHCIIMDDDQIQDRVKCTFCTLTFDSTPKGRTAKRSHVAYCAGREDAAERRRRKTERERQRVSSAGCLAIDRIF
jgi:hypothetical protein